MGGYLKVFVLALVLTFTVSEIFCAPDLTTAPTPTETTTKGSFFSKIKTSVKSAAQSIAKPFRSDATTTKEPVQLAKLPEPTQQALTTPKQVSPNGPQNVSPNPTGTPAANPKIPQSFGSPDFPPNSVQPGRPQDPRTVSGMSLSYSGGAGGPASVNSLQNRGPQPVVPPISGSKPTMGTMGPQPTTMGAAPPLPTSMGARGPQPTTLGAMNPQPTASGPQNVPFPKPNPSILPSSAHPSAPTPVRPRDPFPALGPPQRPFAPQPAAPSALPVAPGPLSYADRVANGKTTQVPTPAPVSAGVTSQTPERTTEPSGITDPELRAFSEMLLTKDTNNAFKYVTLNIQGKTTSQSKNDEAPQRLLEIQPDAYKVPTIEKLTPLYNNYIINSNENEYVTPQEKAEENDLLDAILSTPVMQQTRNLLIEKGKISKDPKDFKDILKQIWFNMYSRGAGKIGSSGFEHIFLTEIKKGDVSGLHNWLYFSESEKMNQANYLGYMRHVDLGTKGAILKFHFKLNQIDKPVATMFIGTSPEMEMAMYTTCFLFRADRICPMQLNGKKFIIRTYTYRYRSKNMIGSAFPEI